MAGSIASLKNYRQSPRKVRLVVDLVRGKRVPLALALLANLPKRASAPIAKLILSAVANAQTNGGESTSAADLVISRVEVNAGLVLKRSMPRARGRAAQILKRTSRVTLALSPAQPKAKK